MPKDSKYWPLSLLMILLEVHFLFEAIQPFEYVIDETLSHSLDRFIRFLIILCVFIDPIHDLSKQVSHKTAEEIIEYYH